MTSHGDTLSVATAWTFPPQGAERSVCVTHWHFAILQLWTRLKQKVSAALFDPFERQRCHNGLARSRECDRRRFDCQVRPIGLEEANLIVTYPFRPPGSEHMIDDRAS